MIPCSCTVKIPGMKGTDTLVQLTDSHFTLMYDDEFGTGATGAEKRTQNAIDRTALFTSLGGGINSGRIRFPYFLEYARQFEAKHILATGDMIDFSSEANIDRMSTKSTSQNAESISHTASETMTGRSSTTISRRSRRRRTRSEKLPEFMGGDIYFEAVDMGDYFIVSLKNDENTSRTDSQLEELGSIGSRKTDTAHGSYSLPFPDSCRGYKSRLGRGATSLSEKKATSTTLRPPRNMYEYVISDESNVVAIFTGHLHFNHEDLVGGKIPQYVTDAAFEGGCRIITVTGE